MLAEFFLATDEAIDSEDVDALLDDYRFDEDVDDAQVIKKRKLAKKRAVVKARKYFNEQKEQYKQPLESRTVASSNESEELKAYKQFAESAKSKEETARKNSEVFQQKTKEVFSNEFKGFEFKVGDKDVTYSPGDTSELILNGIRTVLYKEMGYDPKDLKIHYDPPISYANDVDIREVLTINEQRALIDEDLPMLEDGDMFVADREVIVVEKDEDGDGEIDERKEITVEQ